MSLSFVFHAVAILVVALLTSVNCRGLREGAVVQNVFTVAKIGGLLVLAFARGTRRLVINGG